MVDFSKLTNFDTTNSISKMKRNFIFLAIIFLMYSCADEAKTTADIQWLTGEWSREFNGNTQLESWNLDNEVLQGTSAFINGVDTTKMSLFTIDSKNSELQLTTSEIGFENDVLYHLQSFSTDSIVFYNSTSDWPQTIIYKNLGSNGLDIVIDGNDRGMKKRVKFNYTKLP
jgi:hypothetical protein